MSNKPGRNDPCHCGSGKKYKHCCLERDAAATSAALAAMRDAMEADGALTFDDEDGLDAAAPFEPGQVLTLTYQRGIAHSEEQVGWGAGFQMTEWSAPDIPTEVLETFDREAVWELDGWWGDDDADYPVQFDLIAIQSLTGEIVIEAKNLRDLVEADPKDEALGSLLRVCTALERAAERTGRSWISTKDDDDATFGDVLYDPDAGPDPDEWLTLSESERIAQVQLWHDTHDVLPPEPRAHAPLQAAVETQIAQQIPEVLDALDRLRHQGLTRHEAVHAIAAALSEAMRLALNKESPETDLNASYLARVKRLTADDWRSLAQHEGEDG